MGSADGPHQWGSTKLKWKPVPLKPYRSFLNWLEIYAVESSGLVVVGIVRMAPGAGRNGNTILGIHPQCEAHATSTEAPCCQVDPILTWQT